MMEEPRELDDDEKEFIRLLPAWFVEGLIREALAFNFVLVDGSEVRANYLTYVCLDVAGDLWICVSWMDVNSVVFRADAIVRVEEISKIDVEAN